MLIGLVGLAGSGKDTIAKHLVEHHGFVKLSFADVLKDVISTVFGWDRQRLEGVTPEDRAWREQEDIWWSQKCGQKITPRTMLQKWGTDICRAHFHQKLWIFCLEQRLSALTSQGVSDVVVSDCRFEDECEVIQSNKGILIRVEREIPSWYHTAKHERNNMPIAFPDIHISEYGIVSYPVNYTVMNNGTPSQLFDIINHILELEIEPTF